VFVSVLILYDEDLVYVFLYFFIMVNFFLTLLQCSMMKLPSDSSFTRTIFCFFFQCCKNNTSVSAPVCWSYTCIIFAKILGSTCCRSDETGIIKFISVSSPKFRLPDFQV